MTLKIETIVIPPFEQNCRLLIVDDKCIIVDPGGYHQLIAETISKLGVTPVAVLITHGHLDHVGNAKIICDKYQIKSYGPHYEDHELMQMVSDRAADYGIPGLENFSSDQYFKDGEKISLLGLDFEVKHTPGHSPGHVIYVNKDYKFVIAGDLVFAGSVGRTDLYRSDPQALKQSIKDSILTLDDDYQLFTGHRGDTTVGRERVSNPFLLEFAAN